MRTNFKYILDDIGTTEIRFPSMPALPLYVDMQNNRWCLWAEVETEGEPVTLKIYQVGTGHGIPSGTSKIGVTKEARFVWHWYVGK